MKQEAIEKNMSNQVACMGKQINDLNQSCLIGEHWLAFEYPWHRRGIRSCACGRVSGTRPMGFILPKERPVYWLPVNIRNEPQNYGAGFAAKAVERFVAAGGKLPSWAYITDVPWMGG